MEQKNRKTRILMLLLEYHPVFSGHAIYLQQLIRHLKQMDCEVAVLAADFHTLPKYDVFDGVEIFRFRLSQTEKKWEMKLALRVIAFLVKNRHRYDILHIHGHLDIYGLLTLFNRFTGRHTLSQMVLLGADDPSAVAQQYRFMKFRYKILALMDQFLCISQAIAQSYERFGLPMEKLTYIPQGVDVERFHPVDPEEKQLLRKKLALPPTARIVVFVGAVVRRKGVDTLLEAWAKVQSSYPDALLCLVGQEQFSEVDVNRETLEIFVDELRRNIAEKNLNVMFSGRRDNVEEYLQAADVFVLPSRKEGFGNVILEAMACGLPVVVTFMDGVSSETVTPGDNGFIVMSVNELALSIQKLLEDDTLAAAMGAAGRAKAFHAFALDRIARRYADLYQAIALG